METPQYRAIRKAARRAGFTDDDLHNVLLRLYAHGGYDITERLVMRSLKNQRISDKRAAKPEIVKSTRLTETPAAPPLEISDFVNPIAAELRQHLCDFVPPDSLSIFMLYLTTGQDKVSIASEVGITYYQLQQHLRVCVATIRANFGRDPMPGIRHTRKAARAFHRKNRKPCNK